MGIKIILLIIFFAVMAAVGIYSRRHVTSVDGFVLGGRSVGPWLTAFAYGTSYFSAVVFVGYAGQFGWKYGIASTWIGIGNALIGSLLAWVVLGRRTKVMTQHLGSRTMPDFFGERYKSKSLKITASVIVFVFLIPYTASVYNGLSRLSIQNRRDHSHNSDQHNDSLYEIIDCRSHISAQDNIERRKRCHCHDTPRIRNIKSHRKQT